MMPNNSSVNNFNIHKANNQQNNPWYPQELEEQRNSKQPMIPVPPPNYQFNYFSSIEKHSNNTNFTQERKVPETQHFFPSVFPYDLQHPGSISPGRSAYYMNHGSIAPLGVVDHQIPISTNSNMCNNMIKHHHAVPPPTNLFGRIMPLDSGRIFASVEGNNDYIQNPSIRSQSREDQITNNFDDFIHTALEGCKIAESLANSNQKRPCFKKIDSLCARLQQDLVKTDNVMSDINSQGLAWALKDFIFVFTRIMNAWTIIKRYARSEPEGLIDIQRELCPNFLHAFSRWHLATYELTQSLIKSFVKLDSLVQHKRGSAITHKKTKQSNTSSNCITKDQTFDEHSLNPDGGICYRDNEEDYIRTGIYPILCEPPGFNDPPQFGGHNIAFPLSDPITLQPWVEASPKNIKHEPENRESDFTKIKNSPVRSFLDRRLVDKLCEKDTAGAIDSLLGQVFAIDESKYFFVQHFTENYFPDFGLAASKYWDLRTIISKAQMNSYTELDELRLDLQQIVDTCKRYLHTFMCFELAERDELDPEICNKRKNEIESIFKMKTFVEKMENILAVRLAKSPEGKYNEGTTAFFTPLETGSKNDSLDASRKSADGHVYEEKKLDI